MVQRISDLQVNGQSAGAIVQNYLANVPGATANWNTIAKAIAKYAGNDWDGAGYGAYKRLAQVINALGDQATEKGILSFAELYGRLLTGSADEFDAFMGLFDTSTSSGRTELNTFLENDKDFLENPNSANPNGGGDTPNRGVAGTAVSTNLVVDEILTRYGPANGEFLAIGNTPFFSRSLPDTLAGETPRIYKVRAGFTGQVGRVASWCNKAGGCLQVDLQESGRTVQELLDDGIIQGHYPVKRYLPFDPKVVWPSEDNLYYQCLRCGGVVPSKPQDFIRCRCGNISIDPGAYRLAAVHEDAIKLFEEVTS
jgi:hypothetical protein